MRGGGGGAGSSANTPQYEPDYGALPTTQQYLQVEVPSDEQQYVIYTS